MAARGTPSQRDMYDGLNMVPPNKITDATAQKYYKDASLDPAPGTVVREERPRPGVTIKWDKYGVPFIYGTTDEDTAYGAGWAGTQSRMFAMDVVRYLGAGRLSELLGPAGVNQDIEQLRAAAYTRQDAQSQLDALAGSSPEGAELRSRLDGFVQRRQCGTANVVPYGHRTKMPQRVRAAESDSTALRRDGFRVRQLGHRWPLRQRRRARGYECGMAPEAAKGVRGGHRTQDFR